MTAALAAPPPEPDAQEGGWLSDAFAAVWNGLDGVLPGGNLTVLGVLFALGAFADQASKRKKAGGPAKPRTPGSWKTPFVTLYKAVRSLVLFVWALVRFYGGRELRGPARSTATFWAAGTRIEKGDDQAAAMGSVAFAPPRISLIKQPRRAPSLWARKVAVWFKTYRGRGARVLDRTTRAVLLAARVTAKCWRAGRTTARTLRNWGCWPYAARALVRVIVTALVVFSVVPAWDVWAALVAVLGTALLGPFLPKMLPTEPGDDVVYGPKLWVVLRDDLKLPEDEPRENWLQLPARLADEDARIVLRLPWTYRGSDMEKESITALLNSRLPGDWVGRYSFRGEHATAVYTHKPAPKPPAPAPEPPAAVDIWDPRTQEILASLGPDDFYLGQDTFDRPVIQKMADEQNSWALSIGSGGGKSAFLQWLAVQMLMKRGTVVAIDPKMVSLTPLIGIEGVHEYINPRAPLDMRAGLEWVADVLDARNFEKKNGWRTSFPPLYVFLEEANHLADILKEQHSADKKTGESSADPVWRDVASILRLGREVNVHIIAVFQDFKDNQFGGVSLTPLFPMKFLGSYTENQWKRIMGSRAEMPTIQKKAGRMVLALDTGDVTRIQTPYAPWNPELTKDQNQQEAYRLLTAYYKELRATHGYSTEALYQAPPEPSVEEPPAFIRALSRDEGPEGRNGGPEGGLSEETTGRLSRQGAHVTPADGSVTAPRDRLRLIPGQGQQEPQEVAQADPTAPPELLPLAEISRRLGPADGIPKYDTLRAHKTRRDDFPEPTIINGKELFTESQIKAYYAAQEKKA
ncbi:hypothetical protein [Streptomyces durocortorensis]|uniref:FtsK domain-containing protein n=1 Tax=Streptomyces durocortorensis TaxID=2811104 RepID=A0ABS2I4V6_9ACTN|nr:hypothetical protein [Streptomyces durocortorensis]MBM7057158.1 hypothetical protein [Streptomyces durocortorensis]